MTVDEFLSRLDAVRQRGAGRWTSRCPAHEDKSPSLSIRETDDGKILLRCFAGCAAGSVCAALGIKLKDLFADTPLPRGLQPPRPSSPRVDRLALAWRFELAALDLRLRAEKLIEAGQQLDVADLSDDKLDRALAPMASANADRERAQRFEHTADGLMARHDAERTVAR